MKAQIDSAANNLRDWFEDLLQLCDQTVFATAQSLEHRGLAIFGVLTRYAKILVESRIDRAGALYQPLCFGLAAACRKLDIVPGAEHWTAALKNLQGLGENLRDAAGSKLGLELGTPASLFKAEMDEALANAGVTERPTLFDGGSRNLALGLAVNWGMRFLLAYAVEVKPIKPREDGAKDLGWLSRLTRAAISSRRSRARSSS